MLSPRVLPDHEQASQFVAEWLLIRRKPRRGRVPGYRATPMRAYELFAERAMKERSLVDRCRLLKLDEWVGLPMSDPATCEQHLRNALLLPLGLTNRYIGFESRPASVEAESRPRGQMAGRQWAD